MKQYLTLAACTVGLVGLAGLSVYRYDHRPVVKTVPVETTAQAVAVQKTIDTKANSAALQNASAVVQSYQGQKTALCTEIKANRLTNTLCQ